MGKSVSRSADYAFRGKYEDDNEGNTIHAIGIDGVINAYGGNDYIVVVSARAVVNTTWGHDTIVGGAGYLEVNDTGGDLTVKGASGFTSINKTQSGPITFEGVSGGVKINHTGDKSGIFYSGAAGYNSITRKGLQGDVSFKGAGAYNELWHETNQGNFSFAGAGGANKIDRTWFNRYQGSHGDLTFKGAGAANIISSRVESGNIDFEGAGAANNIIRKGKIGDVTLRGAGASNHVERIREADDVYSETKGNIRFEGVGGYNSLYSDVAHGDIHFAGAGGYNQITRKGTANDLNSEGIQYTKAEEIVLTKATMGGSWIGNTSYQVTGLKSAQEPNTYLFAFADGTHTKINKVQLRNDPQTGKLIYHSTSWYKEGNHLSDIEKKDISEQGGFNATNTDGAYTLSNLTVESRQDAVFNAVQEKLVENEWMAYGGDILVNAANVTLLDAKMGGYAIGRHGETADVDVVKSNRKPNTYIYAKKVDSYTKIVVVQLRNDPKTGILQYHAQAWFNQGDHTANLGNEDISSDNGYQAIPGGIYVLSDLHYSAKAVRMSSGRVAKMREYSDQELFQSATDSGESSGDVHYNGAGGGNVIKSNVTRGNVYFNGAGIANVIEHSSDFGNTEFNGAGGANVIIKKGTEGNLRFNGAGIANVLLHQSQRGDMNVNAGGAANVLVRVGDGRYLAHLLAVGNISIHKGNGNSRIAMGGGFNTHTQIGHGDAFWSGVGGANVLTQKGNGNVSSILVGGTNVLTKMGEGDLASAMLGGANVITHISNDQAISDTKAIALGGANVLTKKGKGDVLSVMAGGANVLTHVGEGNTTGIMLGGANVLTKVGDGDTTGIMFGLGNILTHVGNGQTLGVMAAAGNIFTKVGNDTTIAAMIGAGNIFTHVGEGNAWALMGGAGNIFTKVGNGDALALMLAMGNMFTHVGDGMSVALMIAKGNIATKVGNGDALSAMIGKGNIFTQIGHGSTFAAMIGGVNVLTKVGTGLTTALMIGKANIYTHVTRKDEESTSIGLFAGSANVMTKVGSGTTLAAMFGKANIMTHVGDGLTGVLALGKANIVTKVGNGFMGVIGASEANVVTHVVQDNEKESTTAAVLAGKGNILTKVGKGPTVGLLISKIGNIMTHVGDGTTVGFAKGDANIITKVGDGLGINAAWGKVNIMTHAGDGDRYNFAKGDANIITKVGDGQEVTVVQGQANIVTHVGDGDDYTGAWGKANVITKVGDGRNVVLAKGDANIVTQVGDGDSFNALWSQGNVVTKVGDGIQVTAAKGKGNITTTVGDGLSVTAAHGDLNINTKVGDGVSVNVAWGKFNVNTKVGDGLNVSVMKGKGNANIHVGDGLNVHASYARNNVAIQVGNGDFYNLSVAESNTESNKLGTLFSNIKQTLLGVAGSQGINYLVNGDDANTSGTHKGRGAINLPEVSSLNGFKLTEVDEITSDLKDSLKGSVTGVDAPDIGSIENALGNEKRLNPNQSRNLIINGDFEQGNKGWQHTNGIEASHSAEAYGLSVEGHGERVSELDVQNNTSIYQDIRDLTAGESIKLSFDFARRAKSSVDNGMEVLWNKQVVFSVHAGKTEWKYHTLTLTAKAGSNRLEFKGTGKSDGFGYILDNVVAKPELSDSGIADHMKQDKAAQNALQDKEKAEAGRQRLIQERNKHQTSISATQAQLENTDLDALNANGQTQRNAIQGEAQAETDELQAKVKGLEALNIHAIYHGESGEQHRAQASGLLGHVQTKLDKAGEIARNQLDNAQKAAAGRLGDIKDAVAKSEAGKLKGEQNQQHAEQDVEKARLQAENRRKEALNHEQRANQAGSDGKSAALKAEQRGQNEASAADSKTAQVQNDAKNSKLDGSYKPKRTGATGSGLSGKAYESHYSEHIEKAEQSKSSINPESTVQANGEFSEELQYLDEDLNELADAKKALDRLQINAGIRVKKSILTSGHSEMSVHQPVSQPADGVTEWVRNTPKISGLDLSGLKALGEPHGQPESADGSERASSTIVRARAQKVADTRIIAEKVDGRWNYLPKIDLMSANELQEAAYVKGKILGDSYRHVLDALKDYENILQNSPDYDLEAVEKLAHLRQQVEGYLLGHPDSERIPALNKLLSQIKVRMEESLVAAEPTKESTGKGSFSDLYNKLGNANLKDSKHLYIDEKGDFVTRGKSNIQIALKAKSAENAVEQIKAAVSREYGQPIADAVFANVQARDLAKDGKGIDVSGLRKVHQAIEQQLSPVSATLFIWKPSDHSRLGHAALQIGQGRIQISAEDAGDFNEKNYVSWWPKGGKSTDLNRIFDVSSEEFPDLRIRWRDLSQPAYLSVALKHDVASEENDGFGLRDGERKLEKFIEKLQAAKGIDAKFADISDTFAIMALANTRFLQDAEIPKHIYQPFVEQMDAGGADVFELGKEFAEALRTAAKQQHSPELIEKRIANVIRQFAKRELSDIQDFKSSEADEGRVFRINLAGLDVAAMQEEWQKISQNPDVRYQLLNGNCSSIVAKVLKAGGADKVIGHTWRPKFGVWTPTELFNFAQKLQEVQLETVAKKQHYSPVEELAALSGKNKTLETVIAENDGTPSLNELITKDGLRKEASVFAKPIGPSYQAILDKLDHIHNLTGNEQLSAGFELYQHITRYLNAHPDSKRNTALSGVQTQLGDIMFRGALQEVRSPLLEIAQTRPEMALRIYQIARNEARGDTPGLTDLMVRWVKEDPYLAAKLGYQGEVPADLAFNPKFHVDLGDQFDDFKQCLSKAQDKGLLIHARIDEQNKRVHLGYSYNELLDMTGSEDVKMAVYFLKEVAKQADPNFAGSHEAILLNRFANPAYLVQLEQGRLTQIEAIYHSSHQTDIAAWDKQYSSDALTQLNRQLSDGKNLSSQLSLLLKDRQGLLIGESHGSDLNGLRFVNEQMDELKTHGVTVIGLEHLRSDLAQPLIDKFLAGGDMPAELTAMIETKHLPVDLFEQAKSKGIKIIALDDNSTTRPVIEGSQHGLMYRAGAANNVAVKRLGQLAEGEKFVAIYGDAHLQSHEGIDHFVPGMTHRLGLPALKVDANNRFTAQADDISLRKHYDDVPQLEKNLYKPNRVVGEDLEALGHSDEKGKVLENVAIDNDGTPPRDRESFNPVTRFINNVLYGAKDDRRNVDSTTQIILDDAVTNGAADKITLQGEAGRLAGYYHNGSQKDQAEQSQEKESAKKVVLFIHGSGSSVEEQASTIQIHYQRQGVDMLAVNMRGYGSSDGHPSEKGLYQDARTMFQYLVNDRGIKPENIIIHGYSMGGAVAADLARYAERNGQPVSGLLLDRPMPSMTKALTAHKISNPAGITGVLAKAVNGQFSVEKNLRGISEQTPIMLLTDNEVLGKEGEKLRAKLTVAGYLVSGERTAYGHDDNSLLMNQFAGKIISTFDNSSSDDVTKKPNTEQAATNSFDVKHQTDESEVLKGIESDLKRYGEALKPEVNSAGRTIKDIRTTEGFLAGYEQGYAEQIVDGFRSNMDTKQLVDLLVKGNWSAEQKGALAWEIESRALKIDFQPKAEKFNRLFRDVVSTGIVDTKANEQLAPQLFLLNLSNDGFGGRCDPLSKLVLVAKQLENDGQDGVARQLLEKMYSTAAVLNNPSLYSDSERANANKLLGSLAALHAKNPMANTFIKVWKEKLEDAKALTVDGVVQKITAGNADGKPVLLELNTLDHAMAAWAKGSGENRVYGFYDPNVGIVEFSSAEKFGTYISRFFGESDLNMAQRYQLPKNEAGEIVFKRVVVMDGEILATYRPTLADKTTMRGMLGLPVFDDTPIRKPTDIDATDGIKKPLGDNSPESHIRVNNHDVGSWENITVKPQPESGDSRFSGQIIIQTENDPVVAKAAANLAGKHPDSSVIVQLDANGQYRVVYGNPDKLQSGKLRWQIVGHGREESAQNHVRIGGYSADELALRLKQFNTDFKQAGTPDHISLVGCSLIGDDKRNGFARRFISELDKQGVRTTVSARSSEVSVDSIGRKYTKDAQDQWVHKLTDNKIVLGWNDKGEVESHSERVRRGISENDITLSRVGHPAVDAKAQGAIADNVETFHAPKKRNENNLATSSKSNKQLSYSGNIQVHLGDGEFTTINWGTSNVGIKDGTGGFKSLAFGDNNVMVHIGNGDSKRSVDIAGYQALEGAQLFVGNRNISFNRGRSNDLIVMLEKSIPTPPLVNPFDGASRISGVLQNIAGSFNSQDWLTKQDQQWTLESAKKYVSDLSGLDLTSSVDYKTLTDLDSQNERSSRGLKSDIESTLNKKYIQWLGQSGNTPEMSKLSRADKFRQANEKLAFNFAVGGQGADIQVTTGNWNFMFGDNIQSILDTNLGSLFGLMTQEYTSTGMAKTTFTFSPTDLPRQIKNKLLGNLASVSGDTTLADIFGVDYTADGRIVSRSNQPVDGVAILREMLEVIGEFSGSQLQAFTDPTKLLDGLRAGIDLGADGVKSFAESHGLKAAAPDEKQSEHVSISEENKPVLTTEELQADRALGVNSLNLPNLFATLFSKDKQTEMKSLVTNLKENLTADLLNMQDKTFDFLRNSGHLQDDGDIHVSLGNYNFNWGGDGKDLGAYLGDNNNFWGGRGDDVFYSVGTSNIFAGGEGNDMGVLMGRENMMFGGTGNDVAVLAGRINYAFMGDGDDQIFVFGEGGLIHGNKGRDYIVASGNFNRIKAGEDQDYVVTIGNNNQVDLEEGNDFATVFGNYNWIDGNTGNNSIKLMGYHAMINGGTGNDHLIADVVSKFSQFDGGDGDDLLVLGGYQNRFKGGSGVNSFVVSGNVIDNVVEDIKQGDKIVFNDINWQNLWFQRSGYDLVLLTHRNIKDTSAQGQFEAMGSVTFNNYFNGNRADIITKMGDKDIQGERGYTSLSANAVDSLVQAMSGFAPKMGDSGFIDSLDSQMKSTIVTAWSDTTNGKSKLV
ncbi:MARTX multifunctional-autoprocessing repeats-in-toxin holotoxin RtxA [Xenorhabdus koppenhoeferi]|uniref:MARTX multifunctional-autoprocessing repeats-in-toxin holotoxin RtxA n=1 Tax=Xenorhabdus koppenhoeferi TaxID=351659 RepID=UPI002B40532A|nr:MARTX multifunctional-autoprocessing repeats-in-toxin holotoxin RtxA [Xenorhabdus sp. Vera]